MLFLVRELGVDIKPSDIKNPIWFITRAIGLRIMGIVQEDSEEEALKKAGLVHFSYPGWEEAYFLEKDVQRIEEAVRTKTKIEVRGYKFKSIRELAEPLTGEEQSSFEKI